MPQPESSPSNRSVSIGANAISSAIVAGDSNNISVQFQQAALPVPEGVDIQAELNALKDILLSFNDPIATGVAQKLADEAKKPQPDKSVIGTALETGLTYAKNLQGFAEAIDKLRPHVENAAAWLGENWYKLLPLIGLAI